MRLAYVNRLFLLALAPFIGIMAWIVSQQVTYSVSMPKLPSMPVRTFTVQQPVNDSVQKIGQAYTSIAAIQHGIQKFYTLYSETANTATTMVNTAVSVVNIPEQIYDHRITTRIGSPYKTIDTNKIRLQLFHYNTSNYTGYALKVKLKNSNAMNMVLGDDKIGDSETTLHAVEREGGIAGVNAGGFADSHGKRYPLDTTVTGGKIVYGFFPSRANLSFIGLDQNNHLIGGKFFSESSLMKLHPKFGATFVPILLHNGVKQTIPKKWLTSPRRAPRTVIGDYKDHQLLFVVVDGYNENGSSGATLPELQDKLQNLGVQNAYNLDGGGSSTLVFNGQIINHPSDGHMRPLATNFVFFK